VALNLALNILYIFTYFQQNRHLIAQTAMFRKIIKQYFCLLFLITTCVATLSADIASFEGYATIRTPDKVIQTKGMNNHFVRLSNLTPDTKYFFKINDSQGSSKVYSFQTAPASPYTRLSVIAGGDSRNHRAGRINANKLVGKLRPHFVMFGGDMTGGDNETNPHYCYQR